MRALDRGRMLAIASGGAAGASLRWLVLTVTDPGSFPWPVLVLNVAGSLLVGVLLAEQRARPDERPWLHDSVALGFCGGLTTFSTFAVEVVELVRDDRAAAGAAYVALSVAGAIVAAAIGLLAGRRVRPA
jgi:CrcB protein